jgi:predicted aldo/keto reductase-like oxidoreductase
VDYFDYYLLHNVSGFSEAGFIDVDSFSYVKKLKEEGKIKKLGFSTHANAEYIDNILRLGQKYFKTKKSITHISQEEKKTSINIYFIIQPFFSP